MAVPTIESRPADAARIPLLRNADENGAARPPFRARSRAAAYCGFAGFSCSFSSLTRAIDSLTPFIVIWRI